MGLGRQGRQVPCHFFRCMGPLALLLQSLCADAHSMMVATMAQRLALALVFLLANGQAASAKRLKAKVTNAPLTKLLNTSVSTTPVGNHNRLSTGFYVRPGQEALVTLAYSDTEGHTDKISYHNYQTLYGKTLELGPGRNRVHKMLEIGLGCNTHKGRGIGASARLWRHYFPHAEIWFAEFNKECLKLRENALQALNVRAVSGDQADPATLEQWVKETGGGFDLIIDDGGHSNTQQWQSFIHLFTKALKPGGMYVIEDLAWSVWDEDCQPDAKPPCAQMVHVLSEWLRMLIMTKCDAYDKVPGLKPKNLHLMVPGIKDINCAEEMCTITKCYDKDPRCYYPQCVDESYPNPWKAQYVPGKPLPDMRA